MCAAHAARSLFERRDRRRRFSTPQPLPILAQFGTVSAAPFEYKRQSIGRETSANAIAVYLDGDRLITASSMKMRTRVIRVEHANDDPIEPADLGHAGTVRRLARRSAIVCIRMW